MPPNALMKPPEEKELREKLRTVTARLRSKATDVSIWFGGSEQHYSLNISGELSVNTPDCNEPIQIGCMSKLLTAMATLRLCQQRSIPVDTLFVDAIRTSGISNAVAKLHDIRISHLLNHSHGLDSPVGSYYSRTSDGRLDLDASATWCNSVQRLSAPGVYFSYSDLGAVLAGGLIESVTNKAFGQHLIDTFVSEEGLQESFVSSGTEQSAICPTMDTVLRMRASTMMKLGVFLCEEHERTGVENSLLGSMLATNVGFPGWTTMGKRSCMGLHEYGNGWYGYNSRGVWGSWSIRINPLAMAVICIGAKDGKAALLMPELLDAVSGGIARVKPPRPFNDCEVVDVDSRGRQGTYSVSVMSAKVANDDSRLTLHIDNRTADVPYLAAPITRKLHLAENNCFYVTPETTPHFPIGQFLASESNEGRCEYLWSGTHLWRRTEST